MKYNSVLDFLDYLLPYYMTFTRTPFDGAYDALGNFIDPVTMEVHQEKHHEGYLNKLIAALEGVDHSFESIEALLANLEDMPAEKQDAVRNNGGGLANHNLFFSILSEHGGGEPEGELLTELENHFGSFEDFTEKFSSEALSRFGSGWAWLVVNSEGKLEVYSTANQDSPYLVGHTPILGLDVWEHAYYLHYKNARADYVEAFWDVIDWEEVASKFEEARNN